MDGVAEALLEHHPVPEISAARAMPLLTEALPNPEIHNGLAFQMIDEVRHSTIQMNLKREYIKNYIDPAGSTSPRAFSNNYGDYRPSVRRGLYHRRRDHGVQHLTGRGETAFTNTLFVAMPPRRRPTATTCRRRCSSRSSPSRGT